MQHRHTGGKGTLIVTSQFTESPSADLDEVLRLLGLSEADLSWRHPEVETPAAWGIWRQDDHGHKYLVQIVGFEEGARLLAARLEAAGHKQTYWVQRVESGSQAN